jgi:hypothetical protein
MWRLNIYLKEVENRIAVTGAWGGCGRGSDGKRMVAEYKVQLNGRNNF